MWGCSHSSMKHFLQCVIFKRRFGVLKKSSRKPDFMVCTIPRPIFLFPLIYRRNLLKEKEEHVQRRHELRSWQHVLRMITAAALVEVQTLNPSNICWVLNVRYSKLALKMKAGMSSTPFWQLWKGCIGKREASSWEAQPFCSTTVQLSCWSPQRRQMNGCTFYIGLPNIPAIIKAVISSWK